MYTTFWSENLKGTDHSEDLRVDELNDRIDIRDLGWEAVHWIYVAQDRDQWRAVNRIMNVLVP